MIEGPLKERVRLELGNLEPGTKFVTQRRNYPDETLMLLHRHPDMERVELLNLTNGRTFLGSLDRFLKGRVGHFRIVEEISSKRLIQEDQVVTTEAPLLDEKEEELERPAIDIVSKSEPGDIVLAIITSVEEGMVNLAREADPEKIFLKVDSTALAAGENDHVELRPVAVPSDSTLDAFSPERLELGQQVIDETKEDLLKLQGLMLDKKRGKKMRTLLKPAITTYPPNSLRLSLDEIKVGQYIDGVRSDGVKVTFFVSAIDEVTQRPLLETLSPGRPKRYELSIGKDGTPRVGRYRLVAPVAAVTQVVEIIGRGFMPVKKLRPQFGIRYLNL